MYMWRSGSLSAARRLTAMIARRGSTMRLIAPSSCFGMLRPVGVDNSPWTTPGSSRTKRERNCCAASLSLARARAAANSRSSAVSAASSVRILRLSFDTAIVRTTNPNAASDRRQRTRTLDMPPPGATPVPGTLNLQVTDLVEVGRTGSTRLSQSRTVSGLRIGRAVFSGALAGRVEKRQLRDRHADLAALVVDGHLHLKRGPRQS